MALHRHREYRRRRHCQESFKTINTFMSHLCNVNVLLSVVDTNTDAETIKTFLIETFQILSLWLTTSLFVSPSFISVKTSSAIIISAPFPNEKRSLRYSLRVHRSEDRHGCASVANSGHKRALETRIWYHMCRRAFRVIFCCIVRMWNLLSRRCA